LTNRTHVRRACGAQKTFKENSMSVSKRIFLVLGAGAVIGLSSVAMAQAPKKSTQVTTLGEGEAIMIGPKKERLHKSNSKVSAAKHQAALAKGAKELPGGHRHLQAKRQTLHAAGQRQREVIADLPGRL
jgi:hypothetical protein